MRRKLRRTLALLLLAAGAPPAAAAPGVYETNLDPAVGFNLISWWGGTQGSHWESAVNSLHANGFREVSISPLRFADVDTGRIQPWSPQSPASSLAAVEAGVVRAKQLGMRVTLNPFIELYDSSENQYFADVPGPSTCTWRGCWNPSGGNASRFWSDYEDYLVEIAELAAEHEVEGLGVGTEMRQIVGDASHNDDWDAVIEAVDAVYEGPLHYAANWDHFAFGGPGNVTHIFDHPAIDYVGVDSYFTNLISSSQAAQDQELSDSDFLALVESAWNDNLDNNLLPYAAARGEGKPLLFTEFGHLPFNGTSVDPQNQNNAFRPAVEDTEEQLLAFEGFFSALDGRQDVIPAVHIWQWEMDGSGGSLWNINPGANPNQPHNDELADWLVDFVSTATTLLPGDFDGNGTVDAADYTVWRDRKPLANETVSPGVADAEDYAVWRANFGSTLASVAGGQSVPEPGAMAVLVVSVALAGSRARRTEH